MPPSSKNESLAKSIEAGGETFLSDLQHAIDDRLAEHAQNLGKWAEEFKTAHPFPHIFIDDFLPVDIAEALLDTFPDANSPVWIKQPTEDQLFKLATTDEGAIPALQRYVLFTLNSGRFLRFLEKLTGIEALVSDTKLVGGGLHQIPRGGKLAVHIDYSHHPQNRMFRRLNLLLYLNKDWKEEYKGHLELWDKGIQKAEAKILPVFNRIAIFATSDVSYHGHPEALSCPSEMSRKSLSLYYFTKEPPQGKEAVVHNTLFKSRPDDKFNFGNFIVRTASSGLFRDLVPPIVYNTLRRTWNRRFTGK